MGLASSVADAIGKGILTTFIVIKWSMIVFIGCSIAFGLWLILRRLGFFNMFTKKKIKKKKKKK